MGSWGVGLYTGDFASDLRGTIRAIARLPFEDERLAQIIVEAEPMAASNPEDEDHTTFWLVTADQFLRRGISSTLVRDKAIQIIDSGSDLEMQRRLGQKESGLRQRSRMLDDLRQRLSTPTEIRRTGPLLRKPQPYLMDVGDALVYPTCGGAPRNPYESRPGQLKIYGPKSGQPWRGDSWAAMVIVDRGRAFGFFAWYTPIVVRTLYIEEPPDLDALRQAAWSVQVAGTCSPTHFRRMELQRIGTFPVVPSKVARAFPGLRSGDPQAIADISISNRMTIRRARPHRLKEREPFGRAVRIDDLVS
jgi:hypothetical protein